MVGNGADGEGCALCVSDGMAFRSREEWMNE